MFETVLCINTQRSAYSKKQILSNYETMTVGELITLLQEYDEETPVIFKNDDGYTYGHIYDRFVQEEYVDNE